jgi:asparagine synthase (glutamine-hydrolysing)
MEHRGPDAPCCYAEQGFSKLGHNRLAILDLDSRSNQPFYSHNGRYVITYNGEIYNYRELAQKYRINMQTSCDTELLVELYCMKGPQFLNELNGMFAFVILDTQTGEVFIARDRLGIKPLYYSTQDTYLFVSSEIAPLLELTGNTSFDEIGLRQYRKLRTFFNGRTAYVNIQMFPAAHYMQNGKITRFWQLPEGPRQDPEDSEIEGLLRSAVDYRCISDVPVGSYLSGGLDSTIIAALASKPHTWTVGFEDNNEFEWGRAAAQHLKSKHAEVLINKEEFIELATGMIKKRREPLSVPNEVLLFKMTQSVKKLNTVVLSGEGADELFFGYDRIFRWASTSRWDLQEFARLYSYGSHNDLEIVEDAVAPFVRLDRPIDRVAAFFQIAHLHGLLRRLDNSTMMCGVEARVPFIDYRIVERMAGVAFEFRMHRGEIKAPLKRIFDRILPQSIIHRRKVGFPVPLDDITFPPGIRGATPMDRWLNFNLSVLTGRAWSPEVLS